jgi:hypothetical protein
MGEKSPPPLSSKVTGILGCSHSSSRLIKVRLHQSLELKTRFKVSSRNWELSPPSHASQPTGNSYFIFCHQKTPILAEPIICKIYQFDENILPGYQTVEQTTSSHLPNLTVDEGYLAKFRSS